MAATFSFPDQLETDRLIIRPVALDDGLMINQAVRESFAELHQWMPWAKTLPTIKDSVGVCQMLRVDWLLRKELMTLFIHKQTGELIGCGGFHHFDWDVPTGETGYWCRTKFVGQGFITEAVCALAEFALNTWKFRRVSLRCDERNLRSIRVAERAGFKLEGALRNDAVAPDGTVRTTLVYSRLD